MTNKPQRAKGTHRAARCIVFADRQTLSFIKLLDIAGFFGYTRFAS